MLIFPQVLVVRIVNSVGYLLKRAEQEQNIDTQPVSATVELDGPLPQKSEASYSFLRLTVPNVFL